MAIEATFKVWRPEGFGGVELEKFNNLTNFSLPPYFMEHYDFTVSRGKGTVTYPDDVCHAERMDTLFMQNVGETIGVSVPHDQVSDAWTLRLYPDAMRRVMSGWTENPTTPFFLRKVSEQDLSRVLVKLTREVIHCFDEPSSLLERETRLFGLVHALAEHCSNTPPGETTLGREHSAVRLVKELLQTDPFSDHSLKNLALLSHLNEKYLLGVFKRDVGVTPHSYQTRLRLNRAKALLAVGLPIAAVAADTGFVDQSHLHRTFKKHIRVTPGQFQRGSRTS